MSKLYYQETVLLQEKYLKIAQKAGFKQLTPLQEKVIPLALTGKSLIAETAGGCGKTLAFIIPLSILTDYSLPGLKSLIIVSSIGSAKKTYRLVRKFNEKKITNLKAIAAGSDSNSRNEYRQIQQRQPDIFIGTPESIIDHIRRDNFNFSLIRNCVIEDSDIEDFSGFERDVEFILSKMSGKQNFMVFTSRPDAEYSFYSFLKKPALVTLKDYQVHVQETDKKGKDNNSSNENISVIIKAVIKDMQENAESGELAELKKEIRKNVSFFMRSRFSACLLKHFISSGSYNKLPEKQTPPGESITLFINTGKSKGLFTRDLVKILLSIKNVGKSDIKNIKVLDNYSFADVSKEKADLILAQLNTSFFKGKKISSSYARNSR